MLLTGEEGKTKRLSHIQTASPIAQTIDGLCKKSVRIEIIIVEGISGSGRHLTMAIEPERVAVITGGCKSSLTALTR